MLPIECAGDLDERFDHVVCTGVLHHLDDPDAGLRALRGALAPGGALHVMVYAPYGRAGIYMLQEYARRPGIGWQPSEIHDLAETLRALPPGHPLVPLLETSPDFASAAGLADALLHPRDRAYSVPHLMEYLERGGLRFGRWIRQAPYLPDCGAPAATPHAPALANLTAAAQYAAMELFRGTMVRHALAAYRDDGAAPNVDFDGCRWHDYVPVRLPGTIAVREGIPADAAAVLINRNHQDTDLYLPIDAAAARLLEAVDGRRTIAEICSGPADLEIARSLFERLWRWDQVVFDTSSAWADPPRN
ncbi:MAG TPA: class I SAM-dependent methyltransferase [Candidatus Tumulicola sp.]